MTRALSPGGDSFLVRADQAFDRLIARYAGLFFSGARDKADDWRVSHSWALWAQGFLALPANFILFCIMLFGILPLRLLTPLLGSPFRLLSERGDQQAAAQDATPVAKVENRRAQLQAPPLQHALFFFRQLIADGYATMRLPPDRLASVRQNGKRRDARQPAMVISGAVQV